MAKMRVSMHGGAGSSNHNDRTFLRNWTPDEIKEKAGNIDPNRTHLNFYWATEAGDKKLSDGATFREIELSCYEKYFSKALEETNQKYIKQGHSERVKSIEDWYKSKAKAPSETILQVGDMYSNIDEGIFKKMCIEYVNYLNSAYGKNIQSLDLAIHYDESSPHMHLRTVFYYEENGILKIGQNKALEQAGVPLPNPNEKIGRHNHRKITLDKALRAKWQEIAKSYGFDIETTPRVNVRHKDKEEFINDQIAKKEAQLIELTKKLDMVDKVEAAYKPSEGLKKRFGALGYTIVAENELNALQEQNKAFVDKLSLLEQKISVLQIDSDELKRIKGNPQSLIYRARQQSREILDKANKTAEDLLKSAEYDIRELYELKDYKAHWERIKKKYPQEVKQLEQKYKQKKAERNKPNFQR